MPINVPLHEALASLRDFFSSPESLTDRVPAVTQIGKTIPMRDLKPEHSVNPSSPEAVSWTVGGGRKRVFGNNPIGVEVFKVLDGTYDAKHRRGSFVADQFNGRMSHPVLIALLNEAMENA